MYKFVIEGGHRLRGEVSISGSKNATLPIIAATLLTEGTSVIHNVPQLRDVDAMLAVMEYMGARISREKNKLVIDTGRVNNLEAPYELVRKMRASFLVTGPLIARFGEANVARPGGCAIGPRPIDEHLSGFEALGVEISEEHGYIIAKGKSLKGTEIYLSERSVTATENLLMASTLAEGETKIVNAATEPHIIDLIKFLNSMGAKIKESDGIFHVIGVSKLHPATYTVIPDYLEAGTLMIATAIAKGDVFLREAVAEHSSAEILKLEEMGVSIRKDVGGIYVKCNKRLRAREIKTAPYPGFPTDLQPQICSLLCFADGTSLVKETMYEDRFNHIAELQRMGADIKVDGRTIVINGVKKLDGAEVMASDIRCGAALVIAGLAASGKTKVLRVYHIDRGYERIEEKLARLGAAVVREQA
ncbi:UDP-N-acetylglucosamine 1-carboxyvinyltransferase [candidate division WOR-3 bacterium JGI_Cruoil_03_44_89]|uniref:UDP-N-acetylglucosamine 1-carboxyvinyltransferase n=1 Tax=candidate division WOR-3 bacterium JGI_Cruoil_03_44_89 TaxID=1973748 RepID=A0A235BRA2_UNCW3|nr:MAG: UDP-N-acetylglucosamine 1-carboxyvinyltransferase [candidate division WOR-3 bacterium JGI_Cruoil_03_44_89]